MLSSMSVTLRMWVTSWPLRSSQRTSTSKARKVRRWPRCGAPWVVGPQTYSDTAPSRTGISGAVRRVAVSCSWRFTPSRVLPRQARSERDRGRHPPSGLRSRTGRSAAAGADLLAVELLEGVVVGDGVLAALALYRVQGGDRKSTRLNSSHVAISYAVFCLKKKINRRHRNTKIPAVAVPIRLV